MAVEQVSQGQNTTTVAWPTQNRTGCNTLSVLHKNPSRRLANGHAHQNDLIPGAYNDTQQPRRHDWPAVDKLPISESVSTLRGKLISLVREEEWNDERTSAKYEWFCQSPLNRVACF